MDNDTAQACYDEVSHLLMDCNKKVNTFQISNDWNIKCQDSEKILLECIRKNKDKKFSMEYLIRGRYLDTEKCVITIVHEDKLASWGKKLTKFSQSLYSLEITPITKSIDDINKLIACTMINLPLDNGTRENRHKPITIELKNEIKLEEKTETKSKSNVMSMFKEKPKDKSPLKKGADIKMEIDEEEVTVKRETKSNTVSPPPAVKPVQSSAKKKDTKTKIVTGKSSIASFFSTVPAGTTKQKQSDKISTMNSVTDSDTNKKASIIEDAPASNNTITNGRKRTISNGSSNSIEEISVQKENNKDIHKRMKTEETNNCAQKRKVLLKNRSRIMKMEGSSDEEEDAQDIKNDDPIDEPDTDQNKNDVDIDNETAPNKSAKKRKAKRAVTRTYVDEDGYLNTVKEMEEYSCSDDGDDDDVEQEVTEQKEIIEPKVSKKTIEKSNGFKSEKPVTKSKSTKNDTKPTANVKPLTKQGSIMSFFSKK